MNMAMNLLKEEIGKFYVSTMYKNIVQILFHKWWWYLYGNTLMVCCFNRKSISFTFLKNKSEQDKE